MAALAGPAGGRRHPDLARWLAGEVEDHLHGARQALDAGAVVCLFPETGPATEPGTARRLGLGVAYFALRTDRPIVPIVLGGTHELYRGRRFRLVVLPPVHVRELAGLAPDAPLPTPWSSAERSAAHAVATGLHALTAEPVATAHDAAEPPAGTRKRWRWLQTAWH